MEWHKWTEIENLETEKRKESKSFQYANSIKEWVVTEKIDGTNFGLNITRDDWQFNSRNNLLGKMSSFYNIYANVDMFKPLIEHTQKELVEQNGIQQVSFQGEYFGQKVMNRIDYKCLYDYRLFGMYYVIDGNKVTQSFKHIEEILKQFGLEDRVVPVLGTFTTFEKATQYKNDNSSTFNENASMEGIVIMPYSVPHNFEGYDLIFKNKNEKFCEKMKRGHNVPEDIPSEEIQRMKTLKEIFKKYITESRMYSVISKIGKPSSEKEYGKYVNSFIEDAWKDFMKDNEGLTFTDKERKFITNIGSEGFIIFSVIVEKMKNTA